MATINEALKELRENYSNLPEDPDFENVEFFPGYEGEEEALDFIHLNDIDDYNLIDDPKLGGFILYWNDSNTNESFDEVEDKVEDDLYYDDDAEDFDRRNVEAEKAAIEAEVERSIKELESEEILTDTYEGEGVNESRLSAQEKDDIAKRAWMLNQVIWSMNDENAYSGSWLYLWPDETAEEDVKYYFNTRKDLKELEDLFIKIYKAYHKGGLYTDDKEIIDFAHDMDKKLNLKPIDVIPIVK